MGGLRERKEERTRRELVAVGEQAFDALKGIFRA